MFKTNSQSKIEREKQTAESNYVIRKNDVFELDVFNNQGNKIIDPKSDPTQDSPNQSGMQTQKPKYLVDKDGIVKLPLLQEIKLEGLTIRQAEAILEKEYSKDPYQQAFVVLNVTNKRVTVLGSPGGKVIPLTDENIRLTEVLGLAGGVDTYGKAGNIRVLRGEKVYLADFSTVEGYLRDNILIQSGDIVYVEPVRRPFLEAAQSYAPLVTVFTSLATITFIIVNSRN